MAIISQVTEADYLRQLGTRAGGAEPLVVDYDVAVSDGDGRLRTVPGFLDKVPAKRHDAR